MPAAVNTYENAFDAYGVRVSVTTNDAAAFERLQEFVPPNSVPCESDEVEIRFELRVDGGTFDLHFGDRWNLPSADLEFALGLVDMHLAGYVAVHAPERIFVHASVAAHQGHLIVMPGMSFAGKSSLVEALIRAGAVYYSDEFAVLDAEGRVHPYPKPISLRGDKGIHTTHTAASIGAVVGEEPKKPTLVVMTAFNPKAEWRPSRLSPGEAVLAMLSNTVPARERPEESLRAVRAAVDGATAFESERNTAEELVPWLFEEVERLTASGEAA